MLKFRKIFLEEAQDLLNNYESDLLQLEKKPGDINLIESAFRSMHTLKGTSGMYGFNFISELTHILESIFQEVREKRQEFNKEIFDITFSAIDHLRKLLGDESLSDETLKKEHQDLMSLISNFSYSSTINESASKSEKGEKNSNKSLWHILMRTTESQYFRGISFMNIFRDLAELGCFTIERIDNLNNANFEAWSITLLTNSTGLEIGEVLLFIEDDCTILNISDNIHEEYLDSPETNELSILEAINADITPKKEINTTDLNLNTIATAEIKRISVEATKLDHLMFLVSELITLNSQFALSVKENALDTIHNSIEKLDSLAKQFRNNALELHLVPLNDIVLRFQRLIRDLSKQLDKKIEFQTHGTEIEIDKSIIDKLSEPLIHIIRNCIDHGIESSEQRAIAGKPDIGIIKLSANLSGGKIMIKIEDDGNGIDLEKVKTKAINLGLLKSYDSISKKELIDFIFLPGFSTAHNLTSVSGRGVGMDVVRKKIQDIRGDVIVESEEGKGTAFTLVLQQSISIVDSLLFKVANSYFTVPISDIKLCVDINSEEMKTRKQTSTIPFDNQLIPYIDIRKVLRLGGEYEKKIKLIIFKNDERMMAILSDKIIGEHQAVIKPLDKILRRQSYLTSASQLGDGNLAFMIDTGELMKIYNRAC